MRRLRPASPTVDEDKLHRAIVEGINEFVRAGREIGAETLDLVGIIWQGGNEEGIDPLTLRNRLDALTSQQSVLLEEVLEDMDNPELNARLKALAEEKQGVLEQLGVIQQVEEQQVGHEARQRELAEWLEQQQVEFTQYEDAITRRYVEQVTVLDAETIRIKFRYAEVEIEKSIRE